MRYDAFPLPFEICRERWAQAQAVTFNRELKLIRRWFSYSADYWLVNSQVPAREL